MGVKTTYFCIYHIISFVALKTTLIWLLKELNGLSVVRNTRIFSWSNLCWTFWL